MCLRRTKEKKDTPAKRAISEAQKHLRAVEQRDVEVKKVSEASKKFRRENHFAQDLQALFERGGSDHARHRGA